MKLSELIATNPGLDADLDLNEGDIAVDAIYLLRAVRLDQEPGDSACVIASAEHTDDIVKRGLLASATEIMAEGWEQGE